MHTSIDKHTNTHAYIHGLIGMYIYISCVASDVYKRIVQVSKCTHLCKLIESQMKAAQTDGLVPKPKGKDVTLDSSE
jgi:hypothetical protein